MSRTYKTKRFPVFKEIDSEYTANETTAFLLAVSQTLCHGINHEATRDDLFTLIVSGSVRALCDYRVDYAKLCSADCYSVCQILAFFRKRDDIDLGVDRYQAALAKFLEAEEMCRVTNQKFSRWSRGEFNFSPRVEAVLFSAQRKIARVLGECPALSDLKFRFGPGATTTRTKREANTALKLGDALVCSEALLPILPDFLAEFPRWVGLSETEDVKTLPVEVHPGRVAFVPKDWKTYRGVVVEPMLNTLFQLGVGDYISARLSKCGLSIRDQTKNQRLAKYGSMTGVLATLDLSSASDTISYELVAHLLPIEWFTLLSYGITPEIEVKTSELGPTRRLWQEKFSSMGNGFTFPLETLIFWALTAACCEGEESDVSVYGDDIICPSWRAPEVARVLADLGFAVNPDKSFWSGPFRESCGKDYVLGTDIRPVFVKTSLKAMDMYRLHNYFHNRKDVGLARVFADRLGKRLQIYGPKGHGDGYLHTEDPMRHLKPHKRAATHGYGGYTFKMYVAKPRSIKKELGCTAFPTYNAYTHSLKNDEGGQRLVALEEPRESYFEVDKKGRARLSLPGDEGYRLVSIYTFA